MPVRPLACAGFQKYRQSRVYTAGIGPKHEIEIILGMASINSPTRLAAFSVVSLAMTVRVAGGQTKQSCYFLYELIHFLKKILQINYNNLGLKINSWNLKIAFKFAACFKIVPRFKSHLPLYVQ